MTKFLISTLVLISVVASFAMPPKVTVMENSAHTRDYAFSFTHGNMLPNWSFEDGYYGWQGSRMSRAELASAYGQEVQPVTGSYVGCSGWNGYVISDLVPVGDDSVYTLSLFSYHVNGSSAAPRIFFYSSAGISISHLDARSYDRNARWSLYTYTFRIPEGTHYIGLSLSTTLNATMLFDDVVLESGREASSRGSIGMGISFSDDLGRGHMSEVLVHRELANELLPTECMNGYAVYATKKIEIGARSIIHGGNIGSNDSVFIDNDVIIRDSMLSEIRLDVKNSVRLGDRDSICGIVRYGRSLRMGNQDYVQHSEQHNFTESCSFPQEEYSVGIIDKTVLNDGDSILVPGIYRNLMVRARSTLRFSAGDYYFDRISVEPTASLYFDVAQGNVVIHVKSSLSISDNSSMYHDSTAKYFIGWKIGQSGNIRLGTISGLAGVFVAPNAKIELGHQSRLYGMLYARKVKLMQDSKITTPSFLFYNSTKRFVVGETRYDELGGKIYQEDYPYIASLERDGYVEWSNFYANEYFSPTGDGPDAGGFAFTESEYSDKDGRLLKKTMPGAPWRIGGGHVATSNYGYVSDLNIPQSILVLSSAPKKYKLSYTRDVEGRMSITWENFLGQVVQTAVSIDTIPGANMNAYRWSIKRFEYNREGNLRRVLTPLDMEQNDSVFAVVSEYDAAGRLVSRKGPDVGTEKFFYNKAGNLRLSVSEEQRARNAFSYIDYDSQGRVVSRGESVLGVMEDGILRQIAESENPVLGTKTEYLGTAYDNISSCLENLGSMGVTNYFTGKTLRNTRGRQVCRWMRNPLVAVRIGAEQALVADFYGYDSLGREEVSIRFTGVETDSTRRFVSKTFKYDALSRLSRVIVADANGGTLSVREFSYDDKGRVDCVFDKDGLPIVNFAYDDMGKVKTVIVGDKLETNYVYHLHGQVNAFNVRNRLTGDTLFRQRLDFDNVVASATEKPRYDGMVSRLSTKYGLSDTSGNRVSSFLYDMSGNLVVRHGSAPEATYSFDKNGRMLTQGYDGHIWDYDYRNGSYELSSIMGTIALDTSRNASRPDNFVYDVSGRMIADSSKNLAVEYNPYGKPVLFVQSTDSSVWSELMLYDPSGWRVATLDYDNNMLKMLRTDIMLDGQKALERRKLYAGNDSSVVEYRIIRGKSGIVGRVLPNFSKEWYVKDYQGSLVMTLLDNGTGNVFAYEPYGVQKKIKVTGDSPTEQYTGKEFNDRLGLYYYGARFFDPILGVWLSPDAERQFDNPFHFGGNPVNYVDLDGNRTFPYVDFTSLVWEEVIYPLFERMNVVGWDWTFKAMNTSAKLMAGYVAAELGASAVMAEGGMGAAVSAWGSRGLSLSRGAASTIGSYGSSAVSTLQSYGNSAVTTLRSYGSSTVSTLQSYGSSAVSTLQLYGSSAVSTLQSYGSSAISTIKAFGANIMSTKTYIAGYNLLSTQTSNICNFVEGYAVNATTPTSWQGLIGAAYSNRDILLNAAYFFSLEIWNGYASFVNVYSGTLELFMGLNPSLTSGLTISGVNNDVVDGSYMIPNAFAQPDHTYTLPRNSNSYDKIQHKVENLERRIEDKTIVTIDEIEVDGVRTPVGENFR